MTAHRKDESRETRIKRLIYRANHRGIKEMDIVIGGFANACLADLNDPEIDDFETLMNESDRDLVLWVTGEVPFPHNDLQSLFDRVLAHANQTFSGKNA